MIVVRMGKIWQPWKAHVMEYEPVIGWRVALTVGSVYGVYEYSSEYCHDALMWMYGAGCRGDVEYADLRRLMSADGWFTCRDYLTPVP